MFFILLIEQMKNQDLLDLLDFIQFVSQLVDFFSVEQQIQQNQNFENLFLFQLVVVQVFVVSYIGCVGLVEIVQVEMINSEVIWEYIMFENVCFIIFIVKDEDGCEFGCFDGNNNMGIYNFIWDGLDIVGLQMLDGVYILEVLFVDDDGNNIIFIIWVQGLVMGVDFFGNEVIVEMGGICVLFFLVFFLREDGIV